MINSLPLNIESNPKDILDWYRSLNLKAVGTFQSLGTAWPQSHIEQVLTSQQRGTVVDVRSEAEFALDHLPGAHNLPILNNLERHVVGTLYKHASHQDARDCAWAFYEHKQKDFIQKAKNLKGPLHIMCWRGGGRSRVATQVLRRLGCEAIQIQGGHKRYRKHVRTQLETVTGHLPLLVLAGLTGSGKTDILRRLTALPHIDLEQAAQHCGSVFGAIPYLNTQSKGKTSQAAFENRLFHQMVSIPQNASPILIEDEAVRIGFTRLPNPLYRNMRNANRIWIEMPLQSRIQNIRHDYFSSPKIDPVIKQMRFAVMKLEKYISVSNRRQLISWLEAGRFNDFIEYLLVKYYDPRYRKNPPHVIKRVQAKNVAEAAEQIETAVKHYVCQLRPAQ